jgi:hypothetical protein
VLRAALDLAGWSGRAESGTVGEGTTDCATSGFAVVVWGVLGLGFLTQCVKLAKWEAQGIVANCEKGI